MFNQMERLQAGLAGRYSIEREIGRGSMATVYLAVDQKHGRRVAVKVLLSNIAHSLSAERFLREIGIAARLAHPNILPLLDSGQADGFLYHVTPYMEGETLGSRLKREHELPIPDTVQIAREIADALDYASGEGIIHRDVKPENIILSRGHALIADFGVARAVNVGGGERLTQTGITLGTPAYMSPEQASGERVLDGRSDIYSLACVVYEMLCGKPPLIGRTALATMTRRLEESPRSLRVIRESIPTGIEETILKALSRLPADRFSCAQEFGNTLALTLPGETGVGKTPMQGTVPVVAVRTDQAVQPGTPPEKPSFWAEVKRRKVYNVGVVYVVASWLLVQIADSTFSPLGIPEAAMRFVIYAAVAGFPVALLLAWVFEITAEGIRRTQSIDTRRVRPRKIENWPLSPRSIYVVAVLLIMIALWQIVVRLISF